MKIKNNNKRNKIVILSLLGLVLVVASLVVLESLHITDFINQPPNDKENANQVQSINYEKPTDEQKAAGDLQKKANQSQTNNSLGISITYINTSIDPIQIRSTISGAITNNGNCTLSLTKGSRTITKTSETYALPNSSTCKGFDIQKSELAAGAWQVKIAVTVNNVTSSVTDSFTME